MPKFTLPPALVRAVKPLLTRVVGCGAALSCAAGIGLGAWMQPPSLQAGQATTVVTLPAEQNGWSEDTGGLPALSYAQSVSVPDPDQTAAVSPPAEPSPARVAVAQNEVQTPPAALGEPARDDDADPQDLPAPPANGPPGGSADGSGPAPAAGDGAG